MSYLGDAFVGVLGKPDPPARPGLRFVDEMHQEFWDSVESEIGAGWYRDRFLYLFGEGLERLHECLDAWPFLVPPGVSDRMILGRNAYGALLVLERHSVHEESIYLLDPMRMVFWTDPRIVFDNLLGRWLPSRMVPGFLDDALYKKWRKKHPPLSEGEILAPIIPEPLGGKWTLDNFQPEEIVSYYRRTAPTYQKAFDQMASVQKAPDGGKGGKGGRRR